MIKPYETYKRGYWLIAICPFCEKHIETNHTALIGRHGKKCPHCGALLRKGKATKKDKK